MDIGVKSPGVGAEVVLPAGAPSRGREVANILGIPIDLLTIGQVVEQIDTSVRTRRRLFISTVNLNFLALCRASPEFGSTLRASDICTADGVAVVALCRILGVRIPERVAGSDFVSALAKRLPSHPHISLYFFGGTDDAGSGAAAAVNRLALPHLSSVGHFNPGFGSVDDLSSAAYLDRINASHADFLVVSLGAEKGQSWIVRNLDRFEAPVVSHLGATINFLAGTVQRAPRAVQKIGLEWLWRIYQEPGLYRRYAKDTLSLASLMLTRAIPLRFWMWRAGLRCGSRGLSIIRAVDAMGVPQLKLTGPLTHGHTMNFEAEFAAAAANGSAVTLDLEELDWLDPYGAGSLLVMVEAAKRLGVSVRAIKCSNFVQTGLVLYGLGGLSSKAPAKNL